MREPRSHAASLYGPRPTGAALYASRLMSCLPASRCAGRIAYGSFAPNVKHDATNGDNGTLSRTRTGYGSIARTTATRSNPVRSGTELFGFVAAANENTTSFASNGAPSCQRTPRRRRYVTVRPSAEIPPFARDGTTVARSGIKRPAPSVRSR